MQRVDVRGRSWVRVGRGEADPCLCCLNHEGEGIAALRGHANRPLRVRSGRRGELRAVKWKGEASARTISFHGALKVAESSCSFLESSLSSCEVSGAMLLRLKDEDRKERGKVEPDFDFGFKRDGPCRARTKIAGPEAAIGPMWEQQLWPQSIEER